MNHRKLCVGRGKPNTAAQRTRQLIEEARPAKFSSMRDLITYYDKSITARYIVKAAEKAGLEPKDLGKNTEDICEGIERASLKLLRNDRGYKTPMHAVASLVMAKNDADTAIAILGKMISAAGEGETSNELKNMTEVMKEAKGIGFKNNAHPNSESVADEILRISTHRNYRNSKNGVAVLVLSQKPDDGADIVMNDILPRLSGSEVYDLKGIVRGMLHKKKIEKGDVLLNTLQTRVEEDLRKLNAA